MNVPLRSFVVSAVSERVAGPLKSTLDKLDKTSLGGVVAFVEANLTALDNVGETCSRRHRILLASAQGH